MVIAVEFDGTIVENNYPEVGKEFPGALYILKELQNRGNKLILHTTRKDKELKDAIDFCRKQKLKFDAINTYSPENEKQNVNHPEDKIKADYYINFRDTTEKPDWIKIFWKLYPDEFNYVKLKKPVKKRKFLKKYFRNKSKK